MLSLNVRRWRERLQRVFRFLAYEIAMPVLTPLGQRMPIRVLNPMAKAIGHLAAEPACYASERLLGWRPSYPTILCASRNQRVANNWLLDYWRRYFWVVQQPWLCKWLTRLARVSGVLCDINDYVIAVNKTALAFRIYSAIHPRLPLLSLNEGDRKFGACMLEEMGLPPDAWYVCVHCRDHGYWSTETHQDYRNASVDNYISAMKAIVARGGWCVRMGDPTMPPLPALDKVIDYAHHPLRSERLDIFLCATCRFFVGTASGLAMVPGLFGVPCALTNLAPFSGTLPFRPTDIAIPKMLWSEAEHRYLSFPEVLDSSLGDARFTEMYLERGIRLKENSSEEICELAMELLDRIEGVHLESAADIALQHQFKALFRSGHYSYGSGGRVGRHFLQKYNHLL